MMCSVRILYAEEAMQIEDRRQKMYCVAGTRLAVHDDMVHRRHVLSTIAFVLAFNLHPNPHRHYHLSAAVGNIPFGTTEEQLHQIFSVSLEPDGVVEDSVRSTKCSGFSLNTNFTCLGKLVGRCYGVLLLYLTYET